MWPRAVRSLVRTAKLVTGLALDHALNQSDELIVHPAARRFGGSTLIGPGERHLVERFRTEPLRGTRHHPTPERAIEIGRRFVVGQRPHHHALQSALHEIASRGG